MVLEIFAKNRNYEISWKFFIWELSFSTWTDRHMGRHGWNNSNFSQLYCDLFEKPNNSVNILRIYIMFSQ